MKHNSFIKNDISTNYDFIGFKTPELISLNTIFIPKEYILYRFQFSIINMSIGRTSKYL